MEYVLMVLWWLCGFIVCLHRFKKDFAYLDFGDVLICMLFGLFGPILLVASFVVWLINRY